MKKLTVALLSLFIFFSFVFGVSAQTVPSATSGGGGGGGSSISIPNTVPTDPAERQAFIARLVAIIADLTRQLAEIRQNQPQPTTPTTSTTFTRTLILGSQGDDVLALQKFLISKGYSIPNPEGYFGPSTKEALAQYQTSKGIYAGGGFGPITRAAVNADIASAPQTTPTSPSFTFTRNLTIGSSGADVTALQNFLISKGFSLPDGATGYFGDSTRSALASYQNAKGISPADGYFNAITRASVQAMLAPVPPISALDLKSVPNNANNPNSYDYIVTSYIGGLSFNKLVFRADCNDSEVEINVKGGMACNSDYTLSFDSTSQYSYPVAWNSKDRITHGVTMNVTAYLNGSIVGTDRDSISVTPSNTVSSDASIRVISSDLTLAYQGNDELSFKATFSINVDGGSKGVNISQNYFNAQFVRTSDNSSTYYNSMIRSIDSVFPISSVTDEKGNLFYRVNAGQTANFTVKISVNPKEMFGGSYKSTLYTLDANSSPVINGKISNVNGFPLIAPKNQTNTLVVVGEVSPYISSVTNPVRVGDKMSISGVRFNDLTDYSISTVYIDNSVVNGVDGSKDGKLLFFVVPTLANGSHSVYVKNANGKSNTIYFEVTGGTTQSSITVTSPNGGEKYVTGGDYEIRWKASNFPTGSTVYIELRPNNFNIGSVSKIATVNSTSGYYNWIIPNNIVPANYIIEMYQADQYGNITGPAKDVSDNYFTISSPTTTPPSITVNSPNGGETLTKNTPHTIKWQNNLVYPPCVPGAPCVVPAPKYYDIKLTSFCVGPVCNANIPIPYIVASNVNGLSYEWKVGLTKGDAIVPDGAYTMSVCEAGTNICDSSDSYFKIVSNTNPPSISVGLNPASPASQTFTPGQTNQTFAIIDLKAGNADVTNLNGIQIGSDSLNASNYLTNIRIYDSNNTLIGSAIPTLTYNGSYYYAWNFVKGSSVLIPANTAKSFRLVTDIPKFANGSVRLGIAGLNFDSPGAYVTGTPVYGSVMKLIYSTQPSVTISAPPDGTTVKVGNTSFTGVASGGSGSYKYYWDFGDGGSSFSNYFEGSSQTIAHYFNVPGKFTVKLSVKDSNGAESPTKYITANVSNTIQPSITVTSPNGGAYSNTNPLNISWTPYSGTFDFYYVLLGNSLTGQEMTLTPDRNVSKDLSSYKTTVSELQGAMINLIANSGGKTADQLKDSYYVAIMAEKSGSVSVAKAVGTNFTITSPTTQSLSIAPDSLPSTTVGSFYPSTTIKGSGGTESYKWEIDKTKLPPGIAYAIQTCASNITAPCFSSIALAGKATVAGTYTIPVKLTSGLSTPPVVKNYTIVVNGSTQRSITSLNPTSGPVGTEVTVTGSGFGSNQNNYVLIAGKNIPAVSSLDGKTVKFKVPVEAPANVTQGVSVADSNLLFNTNTLLFTVTGNTQPSITVTSPNGGEKWYVGKEYTITYTLPSPNDQALIYLAKGYDDRREGTSSTSLIGQPGPGVQSFRYLVTGAWPGLGADYKVKVCINYCNQYDLSDNHFSILGATTQPSIELTSPNTGGSYVIGTPLTISWKSTGTDPVYINWLQDRDGDGSYEMVYGLFGSMPQSPTGSLTWTVPNAIFSLSSVNPRNKISVGTSAGTNSVSDTSDISFAVTGTVISPGTSKITAPVTAGATYTTDVGKTVNFTGYVNNGFGNGYAQSAVWSFGDNTPNSSQTNFPSLGVGETVSSNHVYTNPGTYPVTLTLTTKTGVVTKSDPIYVKVVAPTQPLPTASLLVNGQSEVTLKPGDSVEYKWSSSNADKASSSYTSNCGSTSWHANTLNGSLPPSAIGADAAGCNYVVTYTVTQNSTGKTASSVIKINVVRPISISPETLSTGTVGAPYTVTLKGFGGIVDVDSFIWSYVGVLPPGVSVQYYRCRLIPCRNDYILSGTPTQPGKYPITARLTVGAQTISKEYVIVIDDTQASPSITATLVSADVSTQEGPGTNDDVGTFKIRFKVKANNSDVYLNSVDSLVAYYFEKSGTTIPTPSNLSVAISNLTSDVITPSRNYRIPKNEEHTLEFTASFGLGQGQTAGAYRLNISDIIWDTQDLTSLQKSLYVGDRGFRTNYQTLNINAQSATIASVQEALNKLIESLKNLRR